jgi:hypothetical protein
VTAAYAYWNAALAHRDNPKLPQPDFDTRRPETGFYRGQHNEAIAIWWAGDICFAKVHAPPRSGAGPLIVRDLNKADQISDSVFSYCCRHPISHAAYKEFVKTGIWPDDIRSVSVPVNESGTPTDQPNLQDRPPASIGDNLPKEQEKSIEAQLDDLIERANAWMRQAAEKGGLDAKGNVTDQVNADLCANFGVAIAALEKQADAAKDAEKRPHLDANRTIEAKWKKVLEKAETAKRNLKNRLTAWFAAKRDERQATEAAEAKSREEARAAGQPVPLQRARPSTTVAGTAGGRVALKTVTVFTVTDIRAASAYLANLETPPAEFMEAVRLCSSKLIKAGLAVPGISTHNEDIAV